MQPRVHQAFYAVKHKCWEECKRNRGGPEHRTERLRCIKEKCYGPSQAEDRAMAERAGVKYEQMHTPLLMKGVYGADSPRFIAMLRDPLKRCGQQIGDVARHGCQIY